MGLTAMAESCGVSYDVLAWTAEWYFREETLEAANTAIVNYHAPVPLLRPRPGRLRLHLRLGPALDVGDRDKPWEVRHCR